MYLSDIYTITTNLAGIPGLSIPCGLTKSGLPIGLQLMAPAFAEEKLLRTARVFEKATDWHTEAAGAGMMSEGRSLSRLCETRPERPRRRGVGRIGEDART